MIRPRHRDKDGRSAPRRYRISRRISTKTGSVRWAVLGEHLDNPGEWVLLPSRFRSPEDAYSYIAAVTAAQMVLLTEFDHGNRAPEEELQSAC